MKYLLDTNVLSEPRRVERANPAVQARARAQVAASLAISVASLLEIKQGIQSLRRRDQRQAEVLSVWLHDPVRPRFRGRILSVDEDVAVLVAELHVPDLAPERDALMAATALANRLIMVTRHTRDFEGLGLQLLHPWRSDHTPQGTAP